MGSIAFLVHFRVRLRYEKSQNLDISTVSGFNTWCERGDLKHPENGLIRPFLAEFQGFRFSSDECRSVRIDYSSYIILIFVNLPVWQVVSCVVGSALPIAHWAALHA